MSQTPYLHLFSLFIAFLTFCLNFTPSIRPLAFFLHSFVSLWLKRLNFSRCSGFLHCQPPHALLRPLRCVNRLISASLSLPLLKYSPVPFSMHRLPSSFIASGLAAFLRVCFRAYRMRKTIEVDRKIGETLYWFDLSLTTVNGIHCWWRPVCSLGLFRRLWLRSSTPRFEKMTHYGYTMGATELRPIWTLKHSRAENFSVNYLDVTMSAEVKMPIKELDVNCAVLD